MTSLPLYYHHPSKVHGLSEEIIKLINCHIQLVFNFFHSPRRTLKLFLIFQLCKVCVFVVYFYAFYLFCLFNNNKRNHRKVGVFYF